MTGDPKDKEVEAAKRLMGALVRQPPKPHDEMKLGSAPRKKAPGAAKRKPLKPQGRNNADV
jgi:hypothetical protein